MKNHTTRTGTRNTRIDRAKRSRAGAAMAALAMIFGSVALNTVSATAHPGVAILTLQAAVETKLLPDDPGVDEFGTSVAVEGDTAFIGAPLDDDMGSVSGSVYVFVRGEGGWAFHQKLTADDGSGGAYFGSSVAIDGDSAIVGAPGDDATVVNAGAAYVFVRDGTTWTQQQKLTADDAVIQDTFGASVAIDGDTAIVGAPGVDNLGRISAGAAYAFVRDGSTWSLQQKLTVDEGAASDQFGLSVAVDGDTALFGVFHNDDMGSDSGATYVFVRDGSIWSLQQKLTAFDGAPNDYFGFSVSLEGEAALVGAVGTSDLGRLDSGSAYVFVRDGTEWSLEQKITTDDAAAGDNLGRSVSLSGPTALVGATGGSELGPFSGSAYVFVRQAATWSQHEKLTAGDGTAGDYFGIAVALDGGTALVGAFLDDDNGEYTGSAYIFEPVVTAPTIACPDDVSVPAAAGECGAAVTYDVTASGSPEPAVTCDVTSGTFFPVGTTTVTCTATNGIGPAASCSFTVTVVDAMAPVITLNSDLALWSPDHTYRAVSTSQMVAAVNDGCGTDVSLADVVIERVTSDEPDNAAGSADGNTTNDVVIVSDCRSVRLRSERNETKNGRVYTITLRVRDADGNVSRAEYRVNVPIGQNGVPAVRDAVALTVNGACQ